MKLRKPPSSRGQDTEEQTVWLSSGALRPRARRRSTGPLALAAALVLAAGAGGAAWLLLGAEREASVAPSLAEAQAPTAATAGAERPAGGPLTADGVVTAAETASEGRLDEGSDGRSQDRLEAAAPAPAPAGSASARLFCPIVGDDSGGLVSYGAGFVREPAEEDELPAIVLGTAVWRCLDGRDDPARAAIPALVFGIRLGPELELPVVATAPQSIAGAQPAPAAPPASTEAGGEPATDAPGEAAGLAPLAMTLSVDPDDARALLVEAPLEEIAARFQTDALTIAAAEFRLANGAPLIRTSRVVAGEAGAARLAFGELPSSATLSRLFWLDLKLIGADGREYALTLQMGRDARILLAAIIEIDA